VRELDPDVHDRESAARRGHPERNLSGLDLGSSTSSTAVKLRNFASILLAANFARRASTIARWQRTALERARFSAAASSSRRSARRLYATLANQTQFMGPESTRPARGQPGRARASPARHRAAAAGDLVGGEIPYARQEISPNLYFGKLTANSVSATLRASYTFTPQLTLQAYAQAYLSSGHYDDTRPIPVPPGPGTQVTIAGLQAIPAMGSPTPADFQNAALNINVVFRWEYRLGSTIYFVYSRSQVPTVPTSGFTPPAMLDASAFGHGAPRTSSCSSSRPGGRASRLTGGR
jgi:hypothetical protein